MTDSSSQRLPVDPTTGKPLSPRAQPGYYPGYHTLSQEAFWDEATREVVLDRVRNVPPVRFFADSLPLAQAIFDRILPQDDRDPSHRISVLNYVDARLCHGVTDGYRYFDMQPDDVAYRLGLEGIEEIARHEYGRSFVELEPRDQESVLMALREDTQPAGEEIWRRVPARRFWALLVTDAVDAYYAHPYAWDEIGFGGPAYPRGYMRFSSGLPEPWEVREQRYSWEPPPDSLSGAYHPNAGTIAEHPTPNQGGTH